MIKLTKTLLLFCLFIFFSQSVFSQDLWIKNHNNESRSFVIIDIDNGIFVKEFFQKKGDYQDKVSFQEFKTLEEARSYIALQYENFSKIKTLPNWEIDTSASNKKNKNLWIAANIWNEEWEKQYALWLKSEITADFYMRYNIPTDCADSLIGFRWIFARIYSLPVANTVSDTGALFGHFSMRKQWENLSTSANWYDDQLFMTALNYVMDMTSTRTIMASDGLPVAVTQKGLLAGAFIVSQTNGSGHIRTITQNYYDNPQTLPLFTFSSTAPRELRSLYKEAFVDQAWPIRKIREIMAFRWPVISKNSWVLNKKENDARYSEEQFNTTLQEKYYSFIQFVLSRVQKNYDPFSLIKTGIEDLVNYTNIRVTIVRNGYAYCRNHDCRAGTQAYEDWSTPNRDAKYVLKFNEIEDLIRAFDPMYPGLYNEWVQNLNSTELNIEGRVLTLARLRYLFTNKLTSYNPSDSILRRWGLIE